MMKAQLVVLEGPDRGRTKELVDGQTCVVGRGQSSELQLTDPSVSRTHCRVQVDGGKLELFDAGGGGTLVNGLPIQRHTLQPGDVFRIGDTKLRFQFEGVVDHPTVAGPGAPRATPKPNETPASELAGRTFAHFRLDSVHANGVNGTIYRAFDLNKQRVVAVKVMSLDYIGTSDQKERFVRGIKVMAPIRHENIVRLYAASIDAPYCWMAMEFVDGESMTDVVKRIGVFGMLDWQYAFRVGVHIGRALDEAFQHKVIHRNVTPQNILFRTADKVAKLSDLTLAKALDGTLSRQVTQAGELVGNVAYMSPERTRGQEDVDCRSDIYGLGATLYALLTGRPPFEGSSLPATITQIRDAEPTKPNVYQLSIPGMFQDAVLKMLAKRPDDRFQTPAQLLMDLERIGKFQNVTV